MAERARGERVVVVTGVSRRAGIGFAVAQRLLHEGAKVLIHSFSPYDAEQPWGADAGGVEALIGELGGARRVVSSYGRVVLLTSGQHLAPMSDELPYAISKGAIHQMTRSLADALADRAITVNAINPKPIDTGWPSDELRERLRLDFPGGRWGRPEDIAPIVAWLISDDSAWMTGQVLDAEGGFRRW